MKRTLTLMSLLIILACCMTGIQYAYKEIPVTYNGSDTDVVELYENPDDYEIENPDGVADIIVKENLEKTMAANNVAAVVFDFRGYDTLGESFILLTAIAGSFVILSRTKKKQEKGGAA